MDDITLKNQIAIMSVEIDSIDAKIQRLKLKRTDLNTKRKSNFAELTKIQLTNMMDDSLPEKTRFFIEEENEGGSDMWSARHYFFEEQFELGYGEYNKQGQLQLIVSLDPDYGNFKETKSDIEFFIRHKFLKPNEYGDIIFLVDSHCGFAGSLFLAFSVEYTKWYVVPYHEYGEQKVQRRTQSREFDQLEDALTHIVCSYPNRLEEDEE